MMPGVVVFLAALIPILCLGAALIELLLATAQRRGKRPDAGFETMPRQVRVLTEDGRLLRGSPRKVVTRLRREGLSGSAQPGPPVQTLHRWEDEGRVIVLAEES